MELGNLLTITWIIQMFEIVVTVVREKDALMYHFLINNARDVMERGVTLTRTRQDLECLTGAMDAAGQGMPGNKL